MNPFFLKSTFKGSATYWERRYAEGRDSGVGSYGALARYKAQILNGFVKQKNIRSVIELGCGDGNQLSYYEFSAYTGIDVSDTAISTCRARFKSDPTKRFLLHRDFEKGRIALEPADLALSVDVIYHLVEDAVFEAHIEALFSYATRFVIIYSTNFDKVYTSAHHVDRCFTPYIEKHVRDFDLMDTIANPNKGAHTMSDFYVYRRSGS